jgi:large subunit ribosomal protein L10
VRPEKAYAAEEIVKLIDGASSLILTTFGGLDSIRMNLLRKMVSEKSGRYFVVKNRMFRIGARERGLEGLCGFLKGQVGVVFGEDDAVELLKAVVNFGKENEELKVLGGVFEGEVLSGKRILAIATMPPKEVVAGELVGVLASPLSEIVQVLSEPFRSLVFALSSIQEKKESPLSKEES